MTTPAASQSPVRLRLLILLPLVGVAGCGFGSAGVASALGKSSRTVTRTPTQLTLLTPDDAQSGLVTLAVGLDVDPAEALVVDSIQYSLGDNVVPFRPATPVQGFPNELTAGQTVTGTALAARTSKFLSFVWNSHFDLDALRTQAAIARPASARTSFRVTIRNTKTQEVITKTTGEFYLDETLMATVAGGGVGDGITPATATMLDPVGVATDGNREVYVADSGNHRIRMITVAGGVASRIETLIGNGFEGTQTGTRAGSLTSMRTPVALTNDADANLFIAETNSSGGSQLVAYERKTGLMFDFLAGFQKVSSVFMAPSRRLYIADHDDDKVWRLDLAGVDPFLTPPTFAQLQLVGTFEQPTAVTSVEVAGVATVYVAKETDRHVVRVAGSGPPVVVVGGGATPPAVGLDARNIALQRPAALVATATHLFVADMDAGSVLVVDAQSLSIVNLVDRVADGSSTPRMLQRPAGLAMSADGSLFVVETGSGVTAGTSGHQVLIASSPLQGTGTRVDALAAGGARKQVAQALAAVAMGNTALTVERTTNTG